MTRVTCALAVVGASLLVSGATSEADTYAAYGFTYDNSTHTDCYDPPSFGSNSNLTSRAESAMYYLDTVTNLSVGHHSSCLSSTDVVWIESGNQFEDLGFTVCHSWANQSAGLCEQFWVVVNNDEHWRLTGVCSGNSTELLGNLTISVRHELGHTVGLDHWLASGSDCGPPLSSADDSMLSDWVTNAYNNGGYYDYNTHHRNHINCKC